MKNLKIVIIFLALLLIIPLTLSFDIATKTTGVGGANCGSEPCSLGTDDNWTDAVNITGGTLPDGRLSTNVCLLDTEQTHTADIHVNNGSFDVFETDISTTKTFSRGIFEVIRGSSPIRFFRIDADNKKITFDNIGQWQFDTQGTGIYWKANPFVIEGDLRPPSNDSTSWGADSLRPSILYTIDLNSNGSDVNFLTSKIGKLYLIDSKINVNGTDYDIALTTDINGGDRSYNHADLNTVSIDKNATFGGAGQYGTITILKNNPADINQFYQYHLVLRNPQSIFDFGARSGIAASFGGTSDDTPDDEIKNSIEWERTGILGSAKLYLITGGKEWVKLTSNGLLQIDANTSTNNLDTNRFNADENASFHGDVVISVNKRFCFDSDDIRDNGNDCDDSICFDGNMSQWGGC